MGAVAAWAGVTAWGLWAALRYAGGDRLPGLGAPSSQLLAFTPYAAAAAPLPVLVALVLRRWWAAVAATVVATALALAVLPRAVAGGDSAARGPVVRVLTANLLFGQAAPARIVDLVRRSGVDVLSLQELTPEARDRLERAGLTRLLPHSVVDARQGGTGSGIYSRHSLRALPSPAGMSTATPQAEITLPGGRRITVTAVHPLPPLTAAAFRQWRHDLAELPAAAAQSGGTGSVRILAGDFNATLDHASLRRLIERGYADAADRAGAGLVPTWGLRSSRPPLAIDHVLVDRRCAVRRVTVHDLPGSDHRAVYAEIRLP
ncbi:endonuclease/exonuclease/phosphatase family protein [Actinomadura sp. NBRC 104425]|uniref:endonuclease/exonuclease/phosphatase family protein n=1 Tax=Actinomadura sp. NBRC 104425 TaxID=3032204 RepID=UPI0025547D0D|nr:endonuclease/exonuclease/phosphatase family protein [Actinomadura sp. NBRC 104425]